MLWSDETPIIIIGMHRSGTTMIAQILTELGLFQGGVKDPNHEPLFFLEINEWLLRTAGGAWDYPVPFMKFLENDELCNRAIDFMSSRLGDRSAEVFWGAQKNIFGRSSKIISPPKHWGWKDPRNTFTLPLWMRIFPKARVVHVSRHGVDVAASLLARNEEVLANPLPPEDISKGIRANPYFSLNPILVDTVRCGTLEGAFSLWEEYMQAGADHVARLGANCYNISFEGFLEKPADVLDELAEFCGLSPSQEVLDQMAGFGKKSRAYSYRSDEKLKSFAVSVDARLAKFH